MKKLEKLLWEGINTNDLKKVAWALNLGADLEAKNNYGYMPLHRASRWGHTEIAKLLIEAGADVQVKDNFGDTPLHKASRWGHTEIAKLLIEAGATI